jgi:hypothetical protein
MTQKIKVKWKVKGYDGIVIDKDNVVWQLPYQKGLRWYGLRKKEPKMHNGSLHYRINRKYVSQLRLRELAYLHSEVIDTNVLLEDMMPF